MSLLKILEIVAKVILYILSAEADPNLTTGPAKHSRVHSKVKATLEEPQSPPLASLADLEEILAIVDDLIRALVALFTLLGLFNHGKKRGARKET